MAMKENTGRQTPLEFQLENRFRKLENILNAIILCTTVEMWLITSVYIVLVKKGF